MSPGGDEFPGRSSYIVINLSLAHLFGPPHNSDDRCGLAISAAKVVLLKEVFHLALFDFLCSQHTKWYA
jgi:hypothetical protein